MGNCVVVAQRPLEPSGEVRILLPQSSEMKNVRGVILAAGKGIRMNSKFPKMFHPLLGKPLIVYPIENFKKLGIREIFVVVGYKKEFFSSYLRNIKLVVQKRLLGTGNALLSAEPYLGNFKGTILVMAGDIPLIRVETLRNLIKRHKETNSLATILTTFTENPKGYGRILRNGSGKVIGICEETDLDDNLETIKEINSGIYCFESPQIFHYLKKIKINPHKKEYYLTDVIALLSKNNEEISTYSITDYEEVLGINTRRDLSKAEKILKMRLMDRLMQEGVTIVDPDNTYIEEGVKIGRDTVIYPFTVIERDVSIGENCRIGPFCRLRQKTVIEDNVELGNFVELVRSKVRSFTKAKHLTYLGDTYVGKGVNIGAGTIVANFDGRRKNKTFIYDKAFIGSGTILIAPVKVGKRSTTGAGAVVTKNKDVPPGKTVVGVPARILTKEGRR